jgi:dsRNA-specific ribonuclease
MLTFHKGEHASALEPFSVGVPYTQLLQEFAQQFGVDLPSYYYVLTNPTKPHNAVFRCRAAYGGLIAESLGNSQKLARQKAAYELLKKLEEVRR